MSKISDLLKHDDGHFKNHVCTFCGNKPDNGGYWDLGEIHLSICLHCLRNDKTLLLIGQLLGDAIKDDYDSYPAQRSKYTARVKDILNLIEKGIYKAISFDSLEHQE